jgi:hypothetical protein
VSEIYRNHQVHQRARQETAEEEQRNSYVHQILSERGLCSLLRCETQLAQEVSEIYRNHQVHQRARQETAEEEQRNSYVHQILSERGLCSLLRCETQLAQEVSEIYRNHHVQLEQQATGSGWKNYGEAVREQYLTSAPEGAQITASGIVLYLFYRQRPHCQQEAGTNTNSKPSVHQILSERGVCSLLRCETQLAQEVSEIYRNRQVQGNRNKLTGTHRMHAQPQC